MPKPAINSIPGFNFQDNQTTSIIGVVTRIIFENKADDFFIFTIENGGVQYKVKGYTHKLFEGQKLNCSGEWEASKNERFKEPIFKASSIIEEMPTTASGILSLLQSGYAKGINKTNASDLVARFAEDLLSVAETNPHKLREVKGISANKALSLHNAVLESQAIPRIMQSLSRLGLNSLLAMRVFREFGPKGASAIEENPYVLSRVAKIRFSEVDRIARRLGVPLDGRQRILAAAEAVLHREAEKGSTAMLEASFLTSISKALLVNGQSPSDSRLYAAIEPILASSDGVVLRRRIAGEKMISLREYAEAESRIAKKIRQLSKAGCVWNQRGAEINGRHLAQLDEDQALAARTSLANTFSVITGRPGCGKTTITKSIVKILYDRGMTVLLTAPTGRAANHIREATGFRGLTIHRALGARGNANFEYGPNNPLPFDAIIVDEASMLDTRLMDRLLQAVSLGTKIILIGDADQLAAIGAGNILADVIKSKVIVVSTLTRPHRTAQDSAIVLNSHRIINGQIPITSAKGDFRMIHATTEEEQIVAILKQFEVMMQSGYALEDIQVLTPMRQYTETGSNALNAALKAMLNPSEKMPSIERNRPNGVITFSEVDRVMQVSNNYTLDIYNGDIGYIQEINAREGYVSIDFYGEVITLELSDLDDIDHALATTIHKAQGSEFRVVIIPISRSHRQMLDRNLLYTATSRGKDIVILIGDLDLLPFIVNRVGAMARITCLDYLLIQEFNNHDIQAKTLH